MQGSHRIHESGWPCDSAGMAQTVSVIIGAEDRGRLTAVIGDRNRPQKHIQRARIVLLSAERRPVLTVAGQVGVSRPAVWRWQQRFAEAGVDGLLRDDAQTRQGAAVGGDGGEGTGAAERGTSGGSDPLDR